MESTKQLQNDLWKKRFDRLNDDIHDNLNNLFTWATLLNRSIADQKQWIQDKEIITGSCHNLNIDAYLSTEQKLVDVLLTFFNSGNLTTLNVGYKKKNKKYSDMNVLTPITMYKNRTPKKSKSKKRKKKYTMDEIKQSTCVVNNDDEKPTAENLQSAINEMNEIYDKSESEHERLARHITQRREALKNSERQDNIQQHPVKFTLSTTNDTLPNQSRVLDAIPEDTENPKLDNDIGDDNKNKDTKTTTEKKDEEEETIPDVDMSLFAGNVKPINQRAREAPTITPLLRLTARQREKLMFDLFLRAKNRVLSSLVAQNTELTRQDLLDVYENKSTKNLQYTQEDLEKMIHTETDRLVEVWKKDNAFGK